MPVSNQRRNRLNGRPSVHDVLRAQKEHTSYELAEHHVVSKERFARLILEVLDYGVLATKVFVVMYLHRREWTCPELAKEVNNYRQNVNKELRKLREKGYVERISRHKWRIRVW